MKLERRDEHTPTRAQRDRPGVCDDLATTTERHNEYMALMNGPRIGRVVEFGRTSAMEEENVVRNLLFWVTPAIVEIRRFREFAGQRNNHCRIDSRRQNGRFFCHSWHSEGRDFRL